MTFDWIKFFPCSKKYGQKTMQILSMQFQQLRLHKALDTAEELAERFSPQRLKELKSGLDQNTFQDIPGLNGKIWDTCNCDTWVVWMGQWLVSQQVNMRNFEATWTWQRGAVEGVVFFCSFQVVSAEFPIISQYLVATCCNELRQTVFYQSAIGWFARADELRLRAVTRLTHWWRFTTSWLSNTVTTMASWKKSPKKWLWNATPTRVVSCWCRPSSWSPKKALKPRWLTLRAPCIELFATWISQG